MWGRRGGIRAQRMMLEHLGVKPKEVFGAGRKRAIPNFEKRDGHPHDATIIHRPVT